MQAYLSKFTISLILVLSVSLGMHILILKGFDFPLFDNKIILSYVINALLAFVIFLSLFKLKDKYQTQLGFLFLFGSALKFIVFFILFYPSYKDDGDINKLEFASFFIPYSLSLIIETTFLSKLLNNLK
jgi:hypothetical protein